MLVHEAIGKYIHPTRYRQIVETASAERLTREEQKTISEDQSTVRLLKKSTTRKNSQEMSHLKERDAWIKCWATFYPRVITPFPMSFPTCHP